METTSIARCAAWTSLPLLAAALCGCATPLTSEPGQAVLESRSVPLLHLNGLVFKDLNRNGKLDVYEDWRQPPSQRAQDLVRQMTLAEKAGAMMHANPPSTASAVIPGAGTAWQLPGITALLLDKHITSFLNRLNTDVASMATQQNELQALAERGRLGIPVSFSTDPRSQFRYSQGVSVGSGAFTQWPDPVGLAAIGDAELVRKFADSVRQEYLAVGIRVALSPQADLTINPRWHRTNGTFGSDPKAATDLVQAYVSGMQNGTQGIGRDSVVSVVKHWVGYGATLPDGFDSHNYYGRHLAVTSDDVEQHILPFTGAFAAQVGGVMPSYGLPPENLRIQGSAAPIERVGVGFNKQMLTEVLRGRFKFGGVIVSDWQITDDCTAVCRDGAKPGQQPAPIDMAMPWGVENLSKAERFAKAVDAGVDQFGGAKEPEFIVRMVEQGRLNIQTVDASVQRIMVQKLQQGLFENAYVNVAAATRFVGNPAFKADSLDAQRRSVVLLKNDRETLPLRADKVRKVYLYQIDAKVARGRGFTVVERPEDADVALVALSTPFEMLHPGYFFGSRYREGDTGFKSGDPAYEAFKRISAKVPTVVSLYLERPADLSAIAGPAAAIVGNFGVGFDALFDVLTGQAAPSATLPYDLPTPEMAPQPLSTPVVYRRGQGLRY